MGQVMEQAVLQAAHKLEDHLDHQIHTMENLDEDDIEKLRKGRIDVCFAVLTCICKFYHCMNTPSCKACSFQGFP
jgi:hypothetical protein